MIEFAFALLAALGSLYFLLAKRVFDWSSAAFFSALVYFMPGFAGYTGGERYKGSSLAATPLEPEATAIMGAVLLAILLSAVLSDSRPRPSDSPPVTLKGIQYLPHVLLAVSLFCCIVTFATAGQGIYSSNKYVLTAAYSGRWFLGWQTGAVLGTVVAYSARRWGTFILGVLLCLLTLFMAIRMCAALAAIGVFVCKLSSRGRRPLLSRKNGRLAVAIVLFGLFMFGYKSVIAKVKALDLERVGSTISAQGFLESSLVNSEPFATQHVLNLVVRNRFQVGYGHFWEVLWAAVRNPFTQRGGDETIRVSFNDKFQPALLGDIESGMASNIWAELWSAGGWLLLVGGLGIFVYVNHRGSRLMLRSPPLLKGVVASVSGYWVFYMHRNDVYRMLSYAKQIGLLLIAAIVLAKVIRALVAGKHKRRTLPHRP